MCCVIRLLMLVSQEHDMDTHTRASARNCSSLSETFKFWRRHNKNGYANVEILNMGLIILPPIKLKFSFTEFSQNCIIVKRGGGDNKLWYPKIILQYLFVEIQSTNIVFKKIFFSVISSGPFLSQENIKFVKVKIYAVAFWVKTQYPPFRGQQIPPKSLSPLARAQIAKFRRLQSKCRTRKMRNQTFQKFETFRKFKAFINWKLSLGYNLPIPDA